MSSSRRERSIRLTVPEDVEEMITFFNITGCMVYMDEGNRQVGYEDVFTKIDMCRKHYTEVGLGADYVDQFIRRTVPPRSKY